MSNGDQVDKDMAKEAGEKKFRFELRIAGDHVGIWDNEAEKFACFGIKAQPELALETGAWLNADPALAENYQWTSLWDEHKAQNSRVKVPLCALKMQKKLGPLFPVVDENLLAEEALEFSAPWLVGARADEALDKVHQALATIRQGEGR